VWSPDGARVMVAASRSPQPLAETYEWWAVPLDGAQPIATGVADRMKAERIQSVAQFGPSVWGDGRILFSNNQAIYALRVDGDGRSASAVERLTVGTSLYSDPAVGPGGVIAFTSAISEGAIYALPLDVEQGTTTGPAERVTEGAGPFLRSSPSSDGAMVAYLRQTQPAGLLVKNLRTGAVTDLGVLGVTFGPALSPDGSRIAYHDGGGIKVMNAGGGPPRGVCETCSLGDWMPDNRRLVVIGGANIADRFLMIDSDTGSATPVVAGTKGMVLNRPHPTPDGRLLAFREGDSEGARIWLARLDADRAAGPDRWIPMGPPERDARPCGWSPSGRVLYFVSSRDGNRCLYAQRLDPRTSHPAGGPILVKHFHEARNFRIGQAGVLSTGPTNAVRAGKLFYDLFTITADIWTMRPAASHR
jgi:Tol biopolymer transport system component